MPNYNFYCEPSIAYTLDVEESIMSIRTMLVQGPRCHVSTRLHRDVTDHWNPHVRVCLQAERKDGYADIEHRYYAYNLKKNVLDNRG